jgi:hypothetical protein
LDAGRVLKRSVLCPHCKKDYYFTLRAIADNPELRCHGCGINICLRDSRYELLITDVRAALEAIHAVQSVPSFISAHPTRTIQQPVLRRVFSMAKRPTAAIDKIEF